MSIAEPLTIESLGERHPEWRAWLALHRIVRAAAQDVAWSAAVPATPSRDGATTPLIDGAVFAVDARTIAGLVDALLVTAGASPIRAETALAMLDAGITQDDERLASLAHAAGIEDRLIAAVAPLATSPLLQACARAWRDLVPSDWDGAACPVCGAWAAVMEARGVERVYRLRCARCGADWGAEPVRCPYCGERDHEKLAALVSESKSDQRRVEACTVCLGYVKSITALAACTPEDVGLLDLATVELDVAALEHGYARPARPAFRLQTRMLAKPRATLRRLLGRRG